VGVIGLNVMWIVGLIVIEVIVTIPVATLLVGVLPLLIVLRVVEILLPVEMIEMEDEVEAIVDPPLHVVLHLEEEAKEIEAVVQRSVTGEEVVIVIAMIGMIEMTETP
jgi:hypothetical protein